MFKFIADIDEISPSEDEEAAQRALRGEEGQDLPPEGDIFISNKSLPKFKFIADIIQVDGAPPSEDDEAAQHALREEGVEPDSARDVLDDHRARNRPNKPPSQQQLLNAAKRQLQGTDNADVSDVDNNEDEEGTRRTHTRRHKPAETDPKTAGHYPECWREAIDRAKEQFRRFVMLYNLFPSRDTHLQDAARILSKVIADERSEEKLFNPSKSLISIIYV
jgi:hypothetical protein